jgi:hypothetical protein
MEREAVRKRGRVVILGGEEKGSRERKIGIGKRDNI